MARTDWKMDDTVVPNDLNQIGEEINELQADGAATDDRIGDRTISDITEPTSNTGRLTGLLGWLAYMIKAITGGATWHTAPATTLEVAKTHMDDTTKHITATERTIWNAKPDKNGTLQTNLNADMVDGYHLDQDLRTTATPTFSRVTASRFTSTVATGTAPFSVSSQTIVYNLNADSVDGFHFNQDVRSSASPRFNNLVLSNSLSLEGNISSVGDIVTVNGNVYGSRLISQVATGTAPLQVNSTTLVHSLNADMVDGYHLDQDLTTLSSPKFSNLYVINNGILHTNGTMEANGNISSLNGSFIGQRLIAKANTSSSGEEHFRLAKGGSTAERRFAIGLMGVEASGDVGSDFVLWAYNNSGTKIGDVFTANRKTRVVTFPNAPVVGTSPLNTYNATAASTAFAHAVASSYVSDLSDFFLPENRTYVRMRRSPTSLSANTGNIIVYDGVDEDHLSEWSKTDGAFKPKNNGLYLIQVSWGFICSASSGNAITIETTINGNDSGIDGRARRLFAEPASPGAYIGTAQSVVKMSAGELVRVVYYTQTATVLNAENRIVITRLA